MNINFKVRFKNRLFWLSFIPAVFLLVQMILAIFGISVDFSELQGKVLATVDALFGVLAILGVVNDATTEGFSDSERAMGYEVPYPKAKGDE